VHVQCLPPYVHKYCIQFHTLTQAQLHLKMMHDEENNRIEDESRARSRGGVSSTIDEQAEKLTLENCCVVD